ncbi:monovalent cation/H(+) antiporter subunit G [Simkania negevensis]|uniref:Monovalent cation/H(+) antiporter subunit G n=1 Tax=Simkania negevensis TaxID=83561 RepID=A0ABS3AT46_9BACT|nr:monovalent cation/H(+) antiporter subunit G [Simkania negevensis]
MHVYKGKKRIEMHILYGLVLLAGSLFILIGGIGIVKLPDTICRAHALSKAGTLGIGLVLLACLGMIGTYEAAAKILIAICFNFITIPLSGHIFARYAIRQHYKT